MPEQIQNIPLGLLSAIATPYAPYNSALLMQLPAVSSTPRRAPAPTDAPPSRGPGQGLLPNLFNSSGPSGYTPEDVQKILQDRASYYQNFPITPQWNGGRGLGGILPGIANFGSGFMGSYTQGQQLGNARENARIRNDVAQRALGATTFEDIVKALSEGPPEYQSTAISARLAQAAKDEERRRRAELANSIWGTPGEQPAPPAAASAPSASATPSGPAPAIAPSPSPSGVPADYTDSTAGMPIGSGQYAPPAPPAPPEASLDRARFGPSPFSISDLRNSMIGRPMPPVSSPPAGVPMPTSPSAQVAAPIAGTATPAAEPIVQIGNRSLPLSQARALAARAEAADLRSEVLEKAIEDAAKKAPPDPSMVAPRIAGSLQNINRIPEQYGGDAGVFGSATGPFQGAPISGDPTSWLVPLARAWGSMTSYFSTGRNSGWNGAPPSEVRRAIEGSTNSLVATIKPMINPSSANWSDRDQAFLESIIGNLAQANDVAQYRRELNNVRQRLIDNFGIQLPQLDGASSSGQGQPSANDPLGLR